MAGWGQCEFSELRQLAERMDGLQAHMEEISTAMVKELAQRMLDKVTKRTPVGKKPDFEGERTVKVQGAQRRVQYRTRGGEMRFRTQRGRSVTMLTRRGADYERYWSGYVGGNLRRSWQVGNVVRGGDAFEIEVFNTAEYASYVEYGHRQRPGRYVPALGKRLKNGWAKGRFMLTVSEEELKVQAPAIIEKRLAEYLGRM